MLQKRQKSIIWPAALLAGLVAFVPVVQSQQPPGSNPPLKAPSEPAAPAPAPSVPGGLNAKPLPAPDSPEAAREVALRTLYSALATARSSDRAKQIAAAIERMWLDAGSATISVLMERALQQANAGNTKLALQLLDAVVDLVPDYAEGWNRRAYVLFLADQPVRALGDLRRALALEPKHFQALDGMAKILSAQGEKKAALMTLEKLREINPQADNLEQSIEDLKREVEGQGI